MVRAAAVAGRRVSHAALSAVVDLEPAELDLAVRDAVEGHVLVPSSDDFYQFRHALLAEAVYDDLLPGERTACTRRTPGRCRTAVPPARPPSSPATPASPRTTRPR